MSTRPQPDDPLEREIEALFSVDHSPEFRARVRATLADAGDQGRSGFGWRLLPVAAAVGLMVIAAAALLTGRWPTGERDRVAPAVVRAPAVPDAPVNPVARSIPADRQSAAVPAGSLSERPPSQVATVARPVPPRARRTTEAASEVIVSPDEARAFRLLLATIRQDRLPVFVASDGADAAAATGPGLPTPEAIRITAVVIDAIAPFTPIDIAGELQ